MRRALEMAPTSVLALANEAGVSARLLRMIRDGERSATPATTKAVLGALEPLAGQHVAAARVLGVVTGWRKGEVLPLQWRQVDFEAGEVRLEPDTTKNDEGRTFPFRALPALAELLEQQRERTRALERETGQIVPHVFHRNGRPVRDFSAAWRKATTDAGLSGWLFHNLRRNAVRNLERAGVPRSVAMKLTGHKTEAVYRRYAFADAKALSEGVEKLAQLHAADATKRSKVLPLEARP